MSSRREVLIRILALLQRRTLIKPKKSHFKMLKTAPFDCAINKKCCSVDGGRGICPLFSCLPRGIWQLKSPHPREFAIQGKKMLMPGGSAWEGAGRRWNWLMLKNKEKKAKRKNSVKKRNQTGKTVKTVQKTKNSVAGSRIRLICTCKQLLDHCTTMIRKINFVISKQCFSAIVAVWSWWSCIYHEFKYTFEDN